MWSYIKFPFKKTVSSTKTVASKMRYNGNLPYFLWCCIIEHLRSFRALFFLAQMLNIFWLVCVSLRQLIKWNTVSIMFLWRRKKLYGKTLLKVFRASGLGLSGLGVHLFIYVNTGNKKGIYWAISNFFLNLFSINFSPITDLSRHNFSLCLISITKWYFLHLFLFKNC